MAGPVTTVYTISTPATTWTVNHGLGVTPVVNVLVNYNGSLEMAFPLSMTHSSDKNTVTITWTTSKTGQVHILS